MCVVRLAGQSYPVEKGLVHCLLLTCSSGMLIDCMTSFCGYLLCNADKQWFVVFTTMC